MLINFSMRRIGDMYLRFSFILNLFIFYEKSISVRVSKYLETRKLLVILVYLESSESSESFF